MAAALEQDQKDYVYDMYSDYIPSLDLDDVARHEEYLLSQSSRDLIKSIYNYTVDPSNTLPTCYTSNMTSLEQCLKKDCSPVRLYRMQTIKECYLSLKTLSVGDGFTFDLNPKKPKTIASFTFSNNYPFLAGFLSDLKNFLKKDKKVRFEDVDEMYVNKKLIKILEENVLPLIDDHSQQLEYINLHKNFDNDEFVIIDQDPITFREFAENYRDKYNTKFSQDFIPVQELKDMYNNYDDEEGKIYCCLFVLDTKKGLIIKSFSQYPEQDEVLINAKNRFVIKGIETQWIRQSRLDTVTGNIDTAENIPGLGEKSVKLLDRNKIHYSNQYSVPIKVFYLSDIE